jgi:hypothetical protein
LCSVDTVEQIIEGLLSDNEALTKAIHGCDAIISALGPPTTPSILTFQRGTLFNPLRVMIKSARATGIKKLLILGTPSAAVPSDNPPPTLKLFIATIKLFLNAVYSEIVALGRILDKEAKDLDWTMYRLGMLSNKEGVTMASATVGADAWVNATYRPSAAVWILDQIDDSQGEWVRQKPSLYSVARE